MNNRDLETLLLLNRIPFCDARRVALLLQSLHAPSELVRSDILDFIASKNAFGKKLAHAIRKEAHVFNAREERVRALDAQVELLPFTDPRYPPHLLEIHDPPVLLYVKGNIEALHQNAVAVVGSRTASFYGREMARDISFCLAQQGVSVVSGLARGIDTEAHKAAVKANGCTVAVLGCGIDVLYPRENKALAEKMCAHGAIVSEYTFGTEPYPYNFPKRNRIISGLSQGVLVVEAAQRSGSLITARVALDEGREVFCVPGRANAVYAQGTNNLIKQGAKLVTAAQEIMDDLFPSDWDAPRVQEAGSSDSPLCDSSDLFVSQVLSMIDEKPLTPDSLVERMASDVGSVLTALTRLEIAQRIKRDHYGGYVRV